MATDEERLAQLRKDENKAQFSEFFNDAMDAWVTKKQDEAAQNNPKRTTQDEGKGFFGSLFGGI